MKTRSSGAWFYAVMLAAHGQEIILILGIRKPVIKVFYLEP